MKFGMPTLVECHDIYDCIDVAEKNGLDFVEINMSFPQYQVDNLNALKLKKIAKEKNIFYTIHADEQLNAFDFNPDVSNCYMNIMRKSIRFAKEVGISVINMHLLKGVYVTLPDKVILLTDVYLEEYLKKVKAFISMCEEEIGDSDLKIAIENVDTNPFTSSQIEAFKYFMKSDVFALTLDVGHDMCLDGKDRHIFEKYPNKLWHMHLHDSDGRHAHLPLGEGKVNIEEKIAMLRKDRYCLIEVKTIAGLETSVKYLKDRSYMK